MLAKKTENKLFSLILSEVHNSAPSPIGRNPRIPVNKPYSCESGRKYKKCYSFYTTVQVNNIEDLTPEDIKKKLPEEYYDFLNVFDRSKADKLPPHRIYDYKLEFIDGADKAKLPRSRIYSISGPKLKQVKKYLNEHLKKGFIVPSHTLFASLILFVEKLNNGLRFCIDYRRLNQIIKRNRYSIPLIDEVLARIQGYKYITRLDIIAAFNKLQMHPNSEDYTTFITSLRAYKYRVLPFELINRPANY